jgi:hypothetical protein
MTPASIPLRRAAATCFLLAAVALAACAKDDTRALSFKSPADSARTDSIARAQQDSINRAQPGYVVDSIFTTDEEVRRFRAAVGGDTATAFVGGSPSREALVRRFVAAVAANDTASLRAMVVHAREFVDLYYMDSPFSRPPYRQSPSLAWRMIQDPSLQGLSSLLLKLGGLSLTYVRHACDPKVAHEGRTTRYAGCIVTLREAGGQPVTRLLFGSIVERGGQFKFLSYTNKL